MKSALTTLVFATACAASAWGGIDFTPGEGTRTQEGIAFKQILFHQDGHIITYEQPRNWSYTGDAGGLRLSPPNVSQAQVTVQQTPLPAPQVFDEPTTKQLQQIALGAVPANAQNATILEEEVNPLQIHEQPTYGVTIGYNFLGQAYMANVLFVNLGDTQVRFRTVARKADFEQVKRAFRGSLFSLSWQQ